MSITLRRPQAFLNSINEDDFDVLDGTQRIGRIYRRASGATHPAAGVDRPRLPNRARQFPTEAAQAQAQAQWVWSLSEAVASRKIEGRAESQILAVRTLADTYRAFCHPAVSISD